MSDAPEFLFKAFDRLSKADEARLVEFLGRADLLVRGTDKTKAPPFRGGCLPYFGLVLAAALGLWGTELGLSRPVAIGLCLSAAVLSTQKMVRTFIAVQRSRRLLDAESGWYALAWTSEELCFRSLDVCFLGPWSSVQNVKYLDEEAGSFLADTLWIHLDGKEKLLVEPRAEDGRFAGRRLSVWREDMLAALEAATGRRCEEGS